MPTDVAAPSAMTCSWCQGPVDPSRGFKRRVVVRRHQWDEHKTIWFCAHYEPELWQKSLGKRFVRYE